MSSSHAKAAYLSRWSQVGSCADYGITSIFNRKQEIDALVDFIPYEATELLPTLAKLQLRESNALPPDIIIELDDFEDDSRDVCKDAMKTIQPLGLQDISPIDLKLPIQLPSDASSSLFLDTCMELEPISLVPEPEVPGLSELVEVDWLDFMGFINPFEVSSMMPIDMDDPAPIELTPPVVPPPAAQPAQRHEKALDLDPFSLPLDGEDLEWVFNKGFGDTPVPELEEKYMPADSLKALFSIVCGNTVLQEEIETVSLPAATTSCTTTRPIKHTVFGPVGLAWETVENDLDRLPPREVYIEAPQLSLHSDESENALDVVNRAFKKELVSFRRGVWEQALLWDKSWKGSSTGIPQPPEMPSLEWLEAAAPLDMPVLCRTLAEPDCLAHLEELAVLWKLVQSVPNVQPARLNLCIQSWELISQSPVEVEALVENECTEEKETELTPTQEQDETHYIEPEAALSEGTPSTPPPALMSCRSDRTSETRRAEQLGDKKEKESCLCMKESKGLGGPVKILRTTDEPSAVKTMRSFLDKHWERLRRFCGTHGQGVPSARASREEADALWQQALAEGPRRISQQLVSLVLRCTVLLTLLEAFKRYGSVGLLMAAKSIPEEYRSSPSTLGESLIELLSRLGSSRSVLTQCPILRCIRNLLSSFREMRTLIVVVSSPALAEEYEKVSRKLISMIGEDIHVASIAENFNTCKTLRFISEESLLPCSIIPENNSQCFAKTPKVCSLMSRTDTMSVSFEPLMRLEVSNPAAFDFIRYHIQIRNGDEDVILERSTVVHLASSEPQPIIESSLRASNINCRPSTKFKALPEEITTAIELNNDVVVISLKASAGRLPAPIASMVQRVRKLFNKVYVVIPGASGVLKSSSMVDASLAMSMCLDELGYERPTTSCLAPEGATELTLRLSMMDGVIPLACTQKASAEFVANIIKKLLTVKKHKDRLSDADLDPITDERVADNASETNSGLLFDGLQHANDEVADKSDGYNPFDAPLDSFSLSNYEDSHSLLSKAGGFDSHTFMERDCSQLPPDRAKSSAFDDLQSDLLVEDDPRGDDSLSFADFSSDVEQHGNSSDDFDAGLSRPADYGDFGSDFYAQSTRDARQATKPFSIEESVFTDCESELGSYAVKARERKPSRQNETAEDILSELTLGLGDARHRLSGPQQSSMADRKSLRFKVNTCPSPARIRGGQCRPIRSPNLVEHNSSKSHTGSLSSVPSWTAKPISSVDHEDSSFGLRSDMGVDFPEWRSRLGPIHQLKDPLGGREADAEEKSDFAPSSLIDERAKIKTKMRPSNLRKVSFAREPTYSVIESWEDETALLHQGSDNCDAKSGDSHVSIWEDLNSEYQGDGNVVLNSRPYSSSVAKSNRKRKISSVSPSSLGKFSYNPSTVDDITPHDSVSNPGGRLHFRYAGVAQKPRRKTRSWRNKQMPAVVRDGLFTVFR